MFLLPGPASLQRGLDCVYLAVCTMRSTGMHNMHSAYHIPSNTEDSGLVPFCPGTAEDERKALCQNGSLQGKDERQRKSI